MNNRRHCATHSIRNRCEQQTSVHPFTLAGNTIDIGWNRWANTNTTASFRALHNNMLAAYRYRYTHSKWPTVFIFFFYLFLHGNNRWRHIIRVYTSGCMSICMVFVSFLFLFVSLQAICVQLVLLFPFIDRTAAIK